MLISNKVFKELMKKIEDSKNNVSLWQEKYYHKNRECFKLQEQLDEARAELVKLKGLPGAVELKVDFCSEKIGEAIEEERVAVDEITDDGEKGVVDPATNFSDIPKVKSEKKEKAFSSRFMPNVKFVLDTKNELESELVGIKGRIVYVTTDADGNLSKASDSELWFYGIDLKHVNKYEVAPELVPEGMVYDKEVDRLVLKIFTEMADYIPLKENGAVDIFSKKVYADKEEKAKKMTFIHELHEKFNFTIPQCEYVYKTFGWEKCEDILSMCQNCNIEPMSLRGDQK
jgi:hypothetical protein